jgi:hypothetical protein
MPTGLTLPGMQLAAGVDADPARLATAVLGTTVLVIACAAGAVAMFRRREL